MSNLHIDQRVTVKTRGGYQTGYINDILSNGNIDVSFDDGDMTCSPDNVQPYNPRVVTWEEESDVDAEEQIAMERGYGVNWI